MDAVEKQIKQWISSDSNTADFKFVKTKGKEIYMSIGGEIDFSIVVEGSGKFKMKSDLSDLADAVNKFCSKGDRAVGDVLTKATDAFMSDEQNEPDEDNETPVDIPDDDPFAVEEPKPKTAAEKSDISMIQDIEGEFNTKSHPNQVAIQRLIKDYLAVCKSDTVPLGYKADPVNKNLFLWHVKIFGFKASSKKDDIDEKNLAEDLAKYSKQSATQQDYILFEVKFPETYPFKPPFIRILNPRFVQYTGHVTIGGSICFELLTTSGWNPASSIEAIFVQIRHQLIEGKARIDFGNQSQYTESEAKEAFIRTANRYGWASE